MRVLKFAYERIKGKPAPYYYNYSLLTILGKPIRKWVTNVVAPHCVFNNVRIFLYRRCGFKIGKHVFIGMHCYLDDMCYQLMEIGDRVTISYGVYFACHGKGQGHYPIVIKDGAYIGMRASVISKNSQSQGESIEKGVVIGEGAVIGANTLVNKSIPAGSKAIGVPCRIIV